MNHVPRPATRVRHELRRRALHVLRAEAITPLMRRIVLGGPELEGFVTAAADDHLKVIFAEGVMRDYTPRHYDAARGELTLEFVLHGHGPAATWAAAAAPGDPIAIGGPRGSTLIPDDYEAYLLVGDAAALPSIARRLEELKPGMRATALIDVADAAEERALGSPGDATVRFVHGAAAMEAALDGLVPATRDLHAFVACEIEVARRLRARLIERHGLDRGQIKAAGYWRAGEADGGKGLDD